MRYSRWLVGCVMAGAALVSVGWSPLAAAPAAFKAPRPALVIPSSAPTETAFFAGGCFWGVEAVFEHVRGVRSAVSGYAGGMTANPTYGQVSGGDTGHAETVKIVFDPRVVSYPELLRSYVSVIADPTRRDGQGPDRGEQYRTALFPVAPGQMRAARAYLGQLDRARVFDKPIVTRLEPLRKFTVAEREHQDFMARNPLHPYIVAHDRPKVAALKRLFPEYYRG